MGVERQAGKVPRKVQFLPSVRVRRVHFNRSIEVAVHIQTANRQHPAIGQRYQRGIPAAMGHVFGSRPLLCSRIEYDSVGTAGHMVWIGFRAAGGKQSTISKKTIAAAKEIENPAVVALDGERVKIVLISAG